MRVIILGVDPGFANTGWGVIVSAGSTMRCLAYGCVTTTPADSISVRLKQIYDEIHRVIDRYEPEEVAVESIYFSNNAKSAFATGQARGVILLAAADSDLGLGEYSPVQIKRAIVGTGTAEKSQIQFMVRNMLGLDHEPSPDHAADALAAAICHANLGTVNRIERNLAKQEDPLAAMLSRDNLKPSPGST